MTNSRRFPPLLGRSSTRHVRGPMTSAITGPRITVSVAYAAKHGPITVTRLGRKFRVRKELAVRGLTRERKPPVKGPTYYIASPWELVLPRLYAGLGQTGSDATDRRSGSAP